MKKTLLVMGILAAVAIGAWFFVGQASGSRRLASFVPQGSEMVMSINLPSMTKKADGVNLLDMELVKSHFDEPKGELTSLLKKIAAEPKASGIRFTDNPHLFLSKTENSGGLLFGIKDEKKFTQFIQDGGLSQDIQKSGTFHFLMSADGPIILWNTETALVYMTADSTGLFSKTQEILTQTAPALDQLALYKDAYVKGADIFFFVKSTFINNKPNELLGLNFMKQSGDVAYGMGLKFKSGELEMESRTAFEKKEDAKFTKLYSNEAGAHFLAQTAPKNPLMAFQLQLNTSRLYDMLMDNPSSKASLEEMAKDMNIKTKELIKLFTGNIAISMSDMETRQVKQNFFGLEQEQEATIPEAALFIEIEDQELFQKVLDRGDQHPEDGKYTFTIPFIGEFYMVHNEAGVSIMMDPDMASTLAEGNALSNSDFDVLGSYFKKHPNAGYCNLNLDSYPVKVKEMLAEDLGSRFPMFETALKPLDNVYGYQKKERGFLQVHLVNRDQNAFPQLIALVDRLYTMNQQIPAQTDGAEEEMP